MGNFQTEGVSCNPDYICQELNMFLSIAMVFHSLPFSVCVCMHVLQGLVMDSQNGFSQKRFFLHLILLIQLQHLFQYKFFSSSSLYICMCALVGVYKYVHILWLAGSRKIHFL